MDLGWLCDNHLLQVKLKLNINGRELVAIYVFLDSLVTAKTKNEHQI